MEIIKDSPEDVQVKNIIKNSDRALAMASQIKTLVIGQEFTTNKIAYLLKTNLVDAENRIRFMASFGFIEVRQDDKTTFFKINLTPENRKKQVEMAVQMLINNHQQRLKELMLLLSIIETKEEAIN